MGFNAFNIVAVYTLRVLIINFEFAEYYRRNVFHVPIPEYGGASLTQRSAQMQVACDFDFTLSPQGVLKQLANEMDEPYAEWIALLQSDPGKLEKVERDCEAFGRHIASYLLASVLSDPHVKKAVEQAGQAIALRESAEFKFGYQSNYLPVRFACGLQLGIASPYLARRRDKGQRAGSGRRGEEGAGLYPELAALGIVKGASPALAAEVGRQSALLPSLQTAGDELRRRGFSLSQGSLRTILMAIGLAALAARKDDIEAWRAGLLKPQTTFKNKRIAVAFDGGRARIRVAKKGRRRRSGYHGYFTNWREPRLLVIYEIDDQGRMDRGRPVVLDGTFQGDVDCLMELAAYHLYRLGAQEAKQVIFLGDGAEWIWNRVPTIAERVGLKPGQWEAVLDFYHVMEHVNAALQAGFGVDGRSLRKEHEKARRMLRKGETEKLLCWLRDLRKQASPVKKKTITDCLNYLQERIQLIDYKKALKSSYPIGSGAIESAIRRVINMRIKSPGTFWSETMAEVMLYVRAQVLTDNWDAVLEKARVRATYSRHKEYKWIPTPSSTKELPNPKIVLLEQVTRKKANAS